MSSAEFLTEKQEEQLIDAINRAERRTSGEIRVHIEHNCEGEALERAARIFHELGMDETRRKNGALIYVATEDHKAAVYAGEGIHSQVEEGFWSDVLEIIISHFKQDAYEEGLEKGVLKIGEKLEELFPYHQKGDVDELSNEISYRQNKSTQEE